LSESRSCQPDHGARNKYAKTAQHLHHFLPLARSGFAKPRELEHFLTRLTPRR
jgi:hypothetical protein